MPNAESDKRAVKRLLVDVGCKNPPPTSFTLEQVLSLEAASIGGGAWPTKLASPEKTRGRRFESDPATLKNNVDISEPRLHNTFTVL
jgi:hypothetical protein